MALLRDAILKHAPALDPALLDMHLRRMPESYVERYAPADIARHLRLLARLTDGGPVAVEVRPLGGRFHEVVAAGFDRTGAVALLTTALAANGLDLQDLQLSTYLPAEDGAGGAAEPTFFIDVFRVSCRGASAVAQAAALQDRLREAFRCLSRGDLRAAHAAAADGVTPNRGVVPREGLVLGGDFTLGVKVASGGMSIVYAAHQASLNRKVAVKITPCDDEADPGMLACSSGEAQVLGGFACPWIVQVLASGTVPGEGGKTLHWLAMEYLAHGDLATWLDRSGPPPADVGARWLRQALEGLLYAHRHSVLHRDLKPHNLLLTQDGDIKISDFGLFKHSNPAANGSAAAGVVVGTPNYIAPEQALGRPADERSDIYSLGAAFFHVFTGRPPFPSDGDTAVLAKSTRQEAPCPLDVAPHLPRPLAIILGRMLTLRAEDRYQDVRVILEDFQSYERRGLLAVSPAGAQPESRTPPEAPREPTRPFRFQPLAGRDAL